MVVMFTQNSHHVDLYCFPHSDKNCKSFIKVYALQWTETDKACGSMFLLEITLFVCSVQ